MTWDEVRAAVNAQRAQMRLHIEIVDDSPEWLGQMTETAMSLRVLHSALLDLSENVHCERCGASLVIEKSRGPGPGERVLCDDCAANE